MVDTLQEWIKDAGAYELLNTYKVEQQLIYPFVANGEDFYISLLNHLFFILHNKDISDTAVKEELLQLAKGLLVYSEESTAWSFRGVNRNNNLLYIAAIYYLADYNALANLFVQRARKYVYQNDSARLLFSIMAGSEQYARKNCLECDMLSGYMKTGDDELLNLIESIFSEKIKVNGYVSLDDFFDTHVASSVLKRFRTSNLWTLLKPYGGSAFWKEYIINAVNRHIFSLLPSQEDAVKKGALTFDRSFSLKMQTSAGKTFLTELIVYQELRQNPDAKILYLAPLRSLSRELKEKFGRLSREFGFDFRAAYGGCTTSSEEESIEKAQLLIATPETFTTLEGTIDELTAGYTLVICDEGQLLEDKTRGTSYELLLTRLKKNARARFLFISAIIPNISDINEWLGGKAIEVGDSDYRPCKIRFAIAKNDNGHAKVRYANETNDKWSVEVNDFLNGAQMKQVGTTHKSFCCAMALKAMDAGPVMIYCSMKDGPRGCIAHAEEVLRLLSSQLYKLPFDYVKDQELLRKVVEYCSYQLGSNYRLTKCLEMGIAYHHGQMPQDLREVIEASIEKKAIQLVICTKTLSEGINMPIKTAVLANITNPGDGTYRNSLELRDLKNIVGRVGRAGHESYGLILVPINGNNTEPASKVISVLNGDEEEKANGVLYYIVKQIQDQHVISEEEINAFLESEGVADAIDTLINLHKDRIDLDELDLEDVVADSLAYYLGDEKTKKWVKKVFRTRYAYIQKSLNKEEYGVYLETGLPLSDYNDLKSLFADKAVDSFTISSPTDKAWIQLMMETIYSLSSVKRDVSHVSKTKPLFPVHQNRQLCEGILEGWLSGLQYVEISETTGCTTEQAALYVDFIQRTVAIKSQAIVSYVKKTFEVENTQMDLWPDMVKSGVNSEEALSIIDSGLGDRILVNILADYARDNFVFSGDNMKLIDMLQQSAFIDSYVRERGIPVILKERWQQYIRMNGAKYI